jgi:hypothetical protein
MAVWFAAVGDELSSRVKHKGGWRGERENDKLTFKII